MTLVELFSPEPAENLLAALCLKPERVVFLGSRRTMTDGQIRTLRDLLKRRIPEAALTFLRVEERDYAGAARAVADLQAQYPDCVFETNGGGDLLLAAMGGTGQRLAELDIPSQTLRMLKGEPPQGLRTGPLRPLAGIRVAEQARLFGGRLSGSSFAIGQRLPEGLEAEADALWQVYQQEPGIWTKQCTLLASLAARSGGGDTIRGAMKEKPDSRHIGLLREAGLVTDYREQGEQVTLRFRSGQVRRVLTRAGDLLELQVFLAARALPGRFTDGVMGARLDWDGDGRPGGTSNEIDGLLMHGAIPLFVSCKLGSAPKEALYELNSVARRFGGSYAAMALCSGVQTGPEAGRDYLRLRAKDMGIAWIGEVHRLGRGELGEALLHAAAARRTW